jgi:hypothetical protein
MIPPILGFRLLLVVLALAAPGAFACGDAALAQQPPTPTELWEEYPLDPERSSQQPASGTQQGSGSRADPAQVGGDSGGSGAAPATDEARFPLLLVFVGLLALLLVLIPGVGIWVNGRSAGSLRDRLGAVRLPSLPDVSRPVHAVSRLRKGFLEDRSRRRPGKGFLEDLSRRRWSPAMWASRGQEATLGPRAASGSGEPARATDKPAPRKPKARAAAQKKKPPVHKPPPAKPQQVAKPQRAAKPRQAAKPQRSAKPQRAAKPRQTAKSKQAAKAPQGAKPQQAAKPQKPTRPAKRKRPADQRAPSAPVKPGLTEALKPDAPVRKKTALEPAPVRDEPQLVATETLVETKLTCSIFGWRDGTQADFYALASGLQGHDWIVERSPRFEWLVGDLPVEAYEAHAMLVDALVRAGWRHVGSEGVWYRQRFERPVDDSDAEGSEP